MKTNYKWGIIGTGYAKEFAKALASLPEASVIAVASRSQERADQFGREFGLAHCYDSVAAMAANPQVDIIYVASSPMEHARHAIECLRLGKPVLVEKPFTIDEIEAKAVYAESRARNVFCMEALWSRFLPATRQISTWLDEGHIGTVRQVIADFGFCTSWDPTKRHFAMERRGGCLLDVGVYSLAFASMAFRSIPERISGHALLCETGVDEQTAMVLKYPGGGLALLSCASRTQTPHRGCIIGTKGRIEVDGFVWAHGATLHVEGAAPIFKEPKLPLPASCYQALEAMRCVGEGWIESPLLPADEVIDRMRVMDEIRRQIGVIYPPSTVPGLVGG